MARNSSQLERRNETINKMYSDLTSKKEDGIRIYTDEIVIRRIANRVFLSDKTVEEILAGRKK